MSDARAIAAVTRTLLLLLERGVRLDADLEDTVVTTRPLDKARDSDDNANQLNLFLYQAMPSAAWRNQSMPQQGRPGETSAPPLALNLHYLITAFGRNNDAEAPLSHQILGRAMSVLHDHPLLGAAEIGNAFASSTLANQAERLRLTLQPLPVEDIFKLWSGFQTQYRLSVAYEVAVVLIDSARGARTPLPVLRRGEHDRGPVAQGDLVPPFPTIERIALPHGETSLSPGDIMTVEGHDLGGDKVEAVFTHPLLDKPLRLAAIAGATDLRASFGIPDPPLKWLAGPYSVGLEVMRRVDRKNTPPRSTNEVGVPLAPRIVNAPLTATLTGGRATLTVKCAPAVLPQQRVTLLLADQEILARPHPTPTDELSFDIEGVREKGARWVRLRVQGVDSLLVDRSRADAPPVFRDDQKVTFQ